MASFWRETLIVQTKKMNFDKNVYFGNPLWKIMSTRGVRFRGTNLPQIASDESPCCWIVDPPSKAPPCMPPSHLTLPNNQILS